MLHLDKITANKIGIIEQLAYAIHDERHQSYVKHELTELLMQRIFQIICGYDDAFENSITTKDLYRIAEVFVDQFVAFNGVLRRSVLITRIE